MRAKLVKRFTREEVLTNYNVKMAVFLYLCARNQSFRYEVFVQKEGGGSAFRRCRQFCGCSAFG